MSDLRFDPIHQVWVAIARNRLQRPTEYVPIEQLQKQWMCPFCAGNEDATPPALAVYGNHGERLESLEQPWLTRVIPNKYPALDEGPGVESPVGPYRASVAFGTQELIIPTDRHVASFSELTDRELAVSLAACQERIRAHAVHPHLKHSMLFMNCRSAAGASLSHIHLQLMGSPVLGQWLTDRWERDEAHLESTGQSLIATTSDWERKEGSRLVRESDAWTLFCPFASRFPLQTYLVPTTSRFEFQDLPPSALSELGKLCRSVIRSMETILDQPAYNLLLHLAPFEASGAARMAWYLEIFPRITCAAGFEWGTGTWINPVAPETSAKRLKATLAEVER